MDVKNNKKFRTLLQRDTNNCKEATLLLMRNISGQVAIILLGGAGKSDHVSKQQWSYD